VDTLPTTVRAYALVFFFLLSFNAVLSL
jgi:hypothetical protein